MPEPTPAPGQPGASRKPGAPARPGGARASASNARPAQTPARKGPRISTPAERAQEQALFADAGLDQAAAIAAVEIDSRDQISDPQASR